MGLYGNEDLIHLISYTIYERLFTVTFKLELLCLV